MKIREEDVLLFDYVDDSSLTIFPDGINILKKNEVMEILAQLLSFKKIIMHEYVLFMIQTKPELVPLMVSGVLMFLWVKIMLWSGLIHENF